MMDDQRSSMEKAARDLCRCPLCDNTFTAPRILPCFHSFCTDCLDTNIQHQQTTHPSNTFSCPECSRETAIYADDTTHTNSSPPSSPALNNSTHATSPASRFKMDTFVSKLAEVLDALGPDKSCETCARMGEAHPGSDWCMECYDVLCARCTKTHLYGKATSDHSIVSLCELQKLTLDNIMKRSLTHVCPTHVTEKIKMYCLDCRGSVCVQCLSESHRKCENCVPLSQAFDKEENDVAEMMVKLGTMEYDLTDDVIEQESGAGVLEGSVMKAQDAIKKIALDMRELIDKSEKELLDRLYSVSSQLQEKVGDFRETPGSRSDDLKSLTFASNRMDALLKYGSSLEILDLFSSMKDIMSRVDKSRDNSINSSTDDEVRLKVSFELYPFVKNFIQEFESFGEISIQDFKPDDGMSAWGVCVTSQDDVIVVDCRAKKVQKFGITGDLIDHIQISEEPRDVTACSDDDVAITIMKKQIFVVTVSATMSLKRRIKTQKQYDAISASQSRDAFLVSSMEEKCVDVISTQGDLLKSFGALDDGSSVFENPRFVTYTKEGHYVVSDCTNNTVSGISQDGGLVFSYSPKGPHEMKKTQGACCDGSGNLFVADYGNSRVHLLTASGEFQRFVLGRDSGLSRPVAMSISHSNKLVIVQSDGMVKIFGYESMKVKFKGTCWCPRCLANMEKEKGGENNSGTVNGSGPGKINSPKTPPRSPRVSQVIQFGSKMGSTSPPLSPSPLTSPTSPGLSRSSVGSSGGPESPRLFRSQRY